MNDRASAAAHVAVRLDLLGPPRLVPAGLPAIELNRLDAALLALLVFEGGVDRTRAAALLWPDADARRAGLSLRQRIFRLNRGAGTEVVTGARRLVLAAAIAHDLGLLITAAGTDDAGPPRGELLGGLDYTDSGELADWVAAARERWRGARREALSAEAERLEAAGRLAPALRYAERLLEHEPHSEHAHRRLMRLHYLRGDRTAALDAYEACRRALQQQMGEPPGAETRALAERIVGSGGPGPASPMAPPLALLRPPRLVGRDAAWRRLDDAAALGRPALLSGEPGIGKTRLLVDRLQAAGPGLLVDARPGDRRVPHAVLVRLLQALADHQGPPPDEGVRGELAALQPGGVARSASAPSPARLQAALARELVRAAAGGLRLIGLDDLHYADDASLEILLPLTLDVSGPRWLLAVRSAERPALLQRWQDESDPGSGPIVLALEPLSAEAVHELLRSLALPGLETDAWAQALQARTGGHPMLLLETLRAAWSADAALPPRPGPLPPPHSLAMLIEQRLQPLEPGARRLLQLAALADVDFSVPLAAHVLQVHALDLAAPWRELEAAGLLSGDGFAHDLVREAALRSVPEAIARPLHGQIAAHIAATGAPARVAEHLRRAGRPADAAAQWRRAAAGALAAGRRREEAELLQAAAQDFRAAGLDDAAFAAECDRIGALVQCAGGDELRAALQALQARPVDEPGRARCALAAAEAQIVFGEFESVVAAMPAAIVQLAADPEAAVLGTRRLAVALLNLGRAADAAGALESCLPRLQALDDPRARYEFLGEFGTVLERCNRRREGFEHLQRGIALAIDARDVGTAATMYANLGVNRVYWGDPTAAIAATEQGLALRQQHDGLAGLASGMDMTLGAMCRDAGRLGEAIERLERSHAAFVADGNALWTANTASHLALLWLQLGQWARAARVLQGHGEGLPAFIAARLEAARALLEEGQGRSALPGLDRALARLAGADRVDVRLGIQLERLRVLPPAEALVLSGQVACEARQAELMGHAHGAEVLAVDALCRAGRTAEAAERASALAAAASPLVPSGFYRPTLWLALLRALRAGGRADEAARFGEDARADLMRLRASLPPAFHDSHDHRQPVNRALLTER